MVTRARAILWEWRLTGLDVDEVWPYIAGLLDLLAALMGAWPSSSRYRSVFAEAYLPNAIITYVSITSPRPPLPGGTISAHVCQALVRMRAKSR
jgi:hypothetical protein